MFLSATTLGLKNAGSLGAEPTNCRRVTPSVAEEVKFQMMRSSDLWKTSWQGQLLLGCLFFFSDAFSCFLLNSHALIFLFFFLIFPQRGKKDKKKSLLKTWETLCRRKGAEVQEMALISSTFLLWTPSQYSHFLSSLVWTPPGEAAALGWGVLLNVPHVLGGAAKAQDGF